MSTTAAVSPRRVLGDYVPHTSSRTASLAIDALLVVVGAAFVALAAQINIELPIVPITGQTLAVLVVGASLGAVRGASALTLYAVVGILGAPIFAEHEAGAAVVFGATGGFIIGFIVSAGLVGWLSERAWDRRILKAFVTFLAGTVTTFLIGLPWLFVWFTIQGPEVYQKWGYETALQGTIESGLLPFILPGIVKALLAALIIPGAWALVRAVDRFKKH